LGRHCIARFALLVIAAVGGGGACGPDLPERMWRSDHVRYFSRDGDTAVCPAILDELEEHGRVIADTFDIPQTIVSYYKFDGRDDFASNAECGDVAAGCAVNVTVRSPGAFDRPGLVRAYLAEYGRPPPLLAEGAAAALTCQHHPRPVGSWREVYAAPRWSPELVAAGSWLVGYMLKMFRATWLVNLYGALQINATEEQFAASFEARYGMPIDAVWAAAISDKQEPRRCPWECGRPVFALDGQPHALAAACGAGSVQRSVDVPEGGVTRWRIDGAGRFLVRSCDGHEEPLVAIEGVANGPGGLIAPFPTGRYVIDAVVEPGGAPTLAVSVAAGDGLSWPDCTIAPVVSDDLASFRTLSVFYPSSIMSGVTRFATGTDRLGELRLTSEDLLASASLCPSCDSVPASCEQVGAQTARQLATTPGGSSLRVESATAATATFSWF
jgi:hypothetical protein